MSLMKKGWAVTTTDMSIYPRWEGHQSNNKYTILKGPLPTHLLKGKSDKSISNIDKLIAICAAVTYFSA